jgi:hypothetical protein
MNGSVPFDHSTIHESNLQQNQPFQPSLNPPRTNTPLRQHIRPVSAARREPYSPILRIFLRFFRCGGGEGLVYFDAEFADLSLVGLQHGDAK